MFHWDSSKALSFRQRMASLYLEIPYNQDIMHILWIRPSASADELINTEKARLWSRSHAVLACALRCHLPLPPTLCVRGISQVSYTYRRSTVDIKKTLLGSEGNWFVISRDTLGPTTTSLRHVYITVFESPCVECVRKTSVGVHDPDASSNCNLLLTYLYSWLNTTRGWKLPRNSLCLHGVEVQK